MNGPVHAIVGSASSSVVYLIIKNALGEEPTFWGFVGFAGAGGITGLLPDILEPATSPRHRGFFHSYALIAAAGYLAYRFFTSRDLSLQGLKVAAAALCAAYGSHLVLDAFTPAGLPLLA